MALTTGAKMLSGIVVFVIMAKILGPSNFGHIAYAFTLATLYVLIVDYGFTQQLLREVGAKPESINQLVGNIVLVKIFLSVLTVIICIGFFYFFPKDITTERIFWLLLLSLILGSFSEFLNSAFRAVGKYKQETNIATFGSLIHFFCLVFILLVKPTLEWIAFGFVISKFIFFIISCNAYFKSIGSIEFHDDWKKALSGLARGFPYAADSGLTNFFQQVDTLLVNHYLGFASVGLYQAATKWLQGAMQFAPVLSNVYLPTLASNCEDKLLNRKYATFLNLKMIVLGGAGWVFFTFFGAFISNYVYGPTFNELAPLWPYIGSLMLIRYIAASQGVILTAYGKQSVRVYTQIISLIAFVSLSIWLLPILNIKGMLIALNLTFFLIFVIYSASLIRSKIPTGFSLINILITAVISSIALAKICF